MFLYTHVDGHCCDDKCAEEGVECSEKEDGGEEDVQNGGNHVEEQIGEKGVHWRRTTVHNAKHL